MRRCSKGGGNVHKRKIDIANEGQDEWKQSNGETIENWVKEQKGTKESDGGAVNERDGTGWYIACWSEGEKPYPSSISHFNERSVVCFSAPTTPVDTMRVTAKAPRIKWWPYMLSTMVNT